MMMMKYRSKNQIVYESIRKSITMGRYAPGARLITLHDIPNSRLDVAQGDHVELLYVAYLEHHYEDYTPIPMSSFKGGQ